jgi:hypothetical protein
VDTHPSTGILRGLLAVHLPSNQTIHLALTNLFSPDKRKPETDWRGCCVYKESCVDDTTLIGLDYLIRGAMMPQAYGARDTSLYYLSDTVDEDMYIRLNNID